MLKPDDALDSENVDNGQPVGRLSTAHTREIGEELRRIRQCCGIKGTAICREVGWSPAKLSKLESGDRGAGEADVATLLGFYRVAKDTRNRILGMVTEPDLGYFMRMHDDSPDDVLCARMHEARARTITGYEPLLVPSLLQSKAYAEALFGHVIGGQEQLVARLGSRVDRQAVLERESPPESEFYVHEAALSLVVGDTAVMHDQCMRLGFMARRPRLSLRVVPMSTGHAALRHSVTLLTFAEPLRPLACGETDTATVFFDEDTAIAAVRRKFTALDVLALSHERSEALVLHWAGVHDVAGTR
ncbi:helix-turn-helix transcriptional regulator [Umezawaea sp. Da 62-37]|uniref:helix-turn-helix domain-containing protein n=1 Tax=Umezawaea sp. Da 62-37 TaxID=3075927 RepID=UPI0028F72480|nr:helix-turn-helix transcriptional regulator [Umezawaea sp. Da 62-37]WNV86945.1 helix-turn-helix transcriptional regulator [Umezawaea sp. Da 62-37]